MMLPCPAGAAGNLHFNLGVRYPDHDANSGAGTHPEASVDAAFGRSTWPVWIHAYVAGARDEYLKRISSTDSPGYFYAQFWVINVEAGLGAHREWSVGRLRPYVAGGGLLVYQVKGTTYGPEDFVYENGAGGWVGAGAYVPLGRRFHLGVFGRQTFASIDGGYPARGTQVGGSLGWGWGLIPR